MSEVCTNFSALEELVNNGAKDFHFKGGFDENENYSTAAMAIERSRSLKRVHLSVSERKARQRILLAIFNSNSAKELKELSIFDHLDEEDLLVLSEKNLWKNMTALKTLNIKYARLFKSVEWLCSAVQDFKSISHLSLYSCNIATDGIKDLANALKSNSNVKSLTLDYNLMGPMGATYIAGMLRKNSVLTSLSLIYCRLKNKGVIEIAKALKMNKNTSLSALRIADNEIKEEGANAIASLLKQSSTIRRLYINQNLIGDEGAKRIVASINSNQCLKVLSMWSNNLTETSLLALAKMLKTNSSLTYILTSQVLTCEPDSIIQALSTALEHNNSLLSFDCSNEKIQNRGTDRYVKRNLKIQKDVFKRIVHNEDSKGPWNRSKLMFIGQGRAGKTATVRSLLSLPFKSSLESTVGASLTQTQSKTNGGSWNIVDDEDSVGISNMQASLFAEKSLEIENSELQVVNTDKKVSISNNKEYTVEDNVESNSAGITSERKEDVKEPDSFMKRFDQCLDLFLKPEPEQEGLEESVSIRFSLWDYGGQEVFYTMHHLFLTRYGIYLLVFDMREIINNETEASNYLSFWLNSIGLHSPGSPVLLIGTFLDAVKTRKNIRKVEAALKKVLQNVLVDVVANDHLLFFPVSNKTSKGIESIRASIESVSQKQKFVKEPILLSWMYCLDDIMQDDKPWVTFREVQKICSQYSIHSVGEISSMLELFHDRGMLVYLTGTEALRNIVTKDPQWLVKSLSMVIRDRQLHAFDYSHIKKVGLTEDASALFNDGLASRDLLEFLWNGTQVDFLIDLMRQTMLLSDWEFSDRKLFLVPSMMTRIPVEKIEGNTCTFDFNENLPVGAFQRLVCLCVSYSGTLKHSREPVVSFTSCQVWLDSESMFNLTESEGVITLTVPLDKDSPLVLSIIESMITKLNTEVMNQGLTWSIDFITPNGKVSYANAKKAQLKPWFIDNVAGDRLKVDVDLNAFISDIS